MSDQSKDVDTGRKKQNVLNRAQMFKVAKWLDTHKKELDGVTYEHAARQVSSMAGIKLSAPQLAGIARSAELDIEFAADKAPATKAPNEFSDDSRTRDAVLATAILQIASKNDLVLSNAARILNMATRRPTNGGPAAAAALLAGEISGEDATTADKVDDYRMLLQDAELNPATPPDVVTPDLDIDE
jgi:hypothetical protein